jgi:hypothetical protein
MFAQAVSDPQDCQPNHTDGAREETEPVKFLRCVAPIRLTEMGTGS